MLPRVESCTCEVCGKTDTQILVERIISRADVIFTESTDPDGLHLCTDCLINEFKRAMIHSETIKKPGRGNNEYRFVCDLKDFDSLRDNPITDLISDNANYVCIRTEYLTFKINGLMTYESEEGKLLASRIIIHCKSNGISYYPKFKLDDTIPLWEDDSLITVGRVIDAIETVVCKYIPDSHYDIESYLTGAHEREKARKDKISKPIIVKPFKHSARCRFCNRKSERKSLLESESMSRRWYKLEHMHICNDHIGAFIYLSVYRGDDIGSPKPYWYEKIKQHNDLHLDWSMLDYIGCETHYIRLQLLEFGIYPNQLSILSGLGGIPSAITAYVKTTENTSAPNTVLEYKTFEGSECTFGNIISYIDHLAHQYCPNDGYTEEILLQRIN